MSEPSQSPYEPYPGGPYEPSAHPGRPAPVYGQQPPQYWPQGIEPVLTRMPGTVRAAQIVSWVAGAIAVAAVIAIAVMTGDPELMGAAVGGFGIQIALAACAFGFNRGGGGLRTTVITLSCLQAFCGLGSIAAMQPPGLLGMVVGIVVFCLVIGKPARLWFGRPQM
ncbi:hypothetical protein [Nocardia higoensis]|uniref:hypothetical protein n=1 Tax=Nocardia higoensis TaxID=228599 RepID=UPI0003085C7D|nr:hypothetical protein [Nocardia higoensis]